MPPEQHQDKSDNLIQLAHRMYDGQKRIPGGLAHNICEERKRSVVPLAIIEENVPPSREYDGAYDDLNPRSAEANL